MRSSMYLRFTMYPALQLASLVTLLIDPKLLVICGLLYVVVVVLCDGFFGESEETVDRYGLIMNMFVYLTIPLHLAIFYAFISSASGILSYPLPYAILIVATIGLYNAIIGVIIAHELMHKTNPVDFLIAQFCLAFTFHTSAAIDHIYGHHNLVGLAIDNTTSRRGEHFWRYFPRAVIGSHRFALAFEKRRLERKGKTPLSTSNRELVGYLLIAMFIAATFAIGGLQGLSLFILSGVFGLVLIEAGNYISHYGIIRKKDGPIEPRHSWNSFNLISSSFHFNISRHSAHHLNSRQAYWKQEKLADTPIYPFGYSAMVVIALLPPLFFKIAQPELDRWTQVLASAAERKLIAQM